MGRFDEALDVAESSRQVFARAGAVVEEMQAMVGCGRIHLMRAHYEEARSVYKPVIARIEKTRDPWLERVVQNHVAIIEMCLGNYALAMHSAQRSLELCRRYGDRAREGDAPSVVASSCSRSACSIARRDVRRSARAAVACRLGGAAPIA
jgi:hypothetical protein